MRLAELIEQEKETILSNWEAFARALPAGATMDELALRDHATQILEAICKDLGQEQSREQGILKSKGLAPSLSANQTAAQTHALLRARNGFDINALAAEYRALRASVLRLWFDSCSPYELDLEELTRFNEAIDQALCESISFFSTEVDRARNLLLGVLGHDMRTPLSAIQMTAHYLKKLNAGDNVSVAASRLIRSGAAIKGLLDDLTEFNRTQLGLGISIRASETSLSEAFDEQLQQVRIAYPEANIVFHSEGDLHGLWDSRRLQQMLGNLVVNALKYGEPFKPVSVELVGLADEIIFRVGNEGKSGRPIPRSILEQLFDPLRRGSDTPHEEGSLGLGLYICREIALAHKGTISAESNEAGTVFTVRIPRTKPP